MKVTKQARQEAKQLFRSCTAEGALDEARVRRVVGGVLEAKPRGYLAILAHFQRLLKLEVERRTATVESAVPLSTAQRGEIQANLSRMYGRGLSLSFAEDAGLIGGLRVRVGCDVYDGSVRARLERLAESF
jgi:F-type H+-transporting ATPase subunit delta